MLTDGMRSFIQRLLFMLFMLSLTSSGSAQTQRSGMRDPINRFDRTLLTYYLTVHNPAQRVRHLVKVGVHSKIVAGMFRCAGAGHEPIPLADYFVNFYVGAAETLLPAEPILRIEPLQTVEFSVSLIPDATGACGAWAASVTVVAVFDDSTRIESHPERITDADVTAFEERTPGVAEYRIAVRHRYPDIRRQAVERLHRSPLSAAGRYEVAEARLDDADPLVRRAAVFQVGYLHLTGLIPHLFRRFTAIRRLPDSEYEHAYALHEEWDELLGVLTKLRAPGIADSLVTTLSQQPDRIEGRFRELLLELRDPRVPDMVRPLLRSKLAWSFPSGQRGYRRANWEVYLAVCEILIASRDMRSVSYISQAITDPNRVEGTAWNLLDSLRDITPDDQIVSDPFVRAFEPAIRQAMAHPDPAARRVAQDLLRRLHN